MGVAFLWLTQIPQISRFCTPGVKSHRSSPHCSKKNALSTTNYHKFPQIIFEISVSLKEQECREPSVRFPTIKRKIQCDLWDLCELWKSEHTDMPHDLSTNLREVSHHQKKNSVRSVGSVWASAHYPPLAVRSVWAQESHGFFWLITLFLCLMHKIMGAIWWIRRAVE